MVNVPELNFLRNNLVAIWNMVNSLYCCADDTCDTDETDDTDNTDNTDNTDDQADRDFFWPQTVVLLKILASERVFLNFLTESAGFCISRQRILKAILGRPHSFRMAIICEAGLIILVRPFRLPPSRPRRIWCTTCRRCMSRSRSMIQALSPGRSITDRTLAAE